VRWDPNHKKPPGGNLFITRWLKVEPIVSPSSSRIDSQLPQLRIQLGPAKKKPEVPHQSYFFLFWGVFVIGRRDCIT
jgi:hypothetical protein